MPHTRKNSLIFSPISKDTGAFTNLVMHKFNINPAVHGPSPKGVHVRYSQTELPIERQQGGCTAFYWSGCTAESNP